METLLEGAHGKLSSAEMIGGGKGPEETYEAECTTLAELAAHAVEEILKDTLCCRCWCLHFPTKSFVVDPIIFMFVALV